MHTWNNNPVKPRQQKLLYSGALHTFLIRLPLQAALAIGVLHACFTELSCSELPNVGQLVLMNKGQ